MKKLIISMLSVSMLASGVVLPVSAANNTETISYTYTAGEGKTYQREMEKLGRGLVAIKTDEGVYLSWRLLDSEDNIFGSAESNVSFNVYRNNGSAPIATVRSSTNYTDTTAGTAYSVAPVIDGIEGDKCASVSVQSNNYFDINISKYKPADANLPRIASLKASDGKNYNYIVTKDAPETISSSIYASSVNYIASDFHDTSTAYKDYEYKINDCSVGDVDGDGEYEIILKWDCNGQDNSLSGVTGDVLIDAYEMDGTQLWRINLGKNIRAGAHYTQFLVYDFDGDGKAEMTCKTAPGSTDSKGDYVTKKSHVTAIKNISDEINETDYRNGSGYIVDGDEYLTVFNGETGEAMDTIYYPNQRVEAHVWGDRLQDAGGNRVDRFTAAVAYMDGVKPYAVYMRGYYMRQNGGNSERQAACAVSYEDGKLDCKYSFDTYDVDTYSAKSSSPSYANGIYKGVKGYYQGNEIYPGEGNHNCSVADVDNDGRDEVMTGALCYEIDKDDNNIERLKVKWCTFLEHGDALHIGDYDPTIPGFEFFTVQEDGGTDSDGNTLTNKFNGNPIHYGMTVVRADTGEQLFHEDGDDDTGRGVMANIGMGGYYQMWSSKNQLRISNGGASYTTGSKSGLSQNYRIFWDGDLYDELLDGTGKENCDVYVQSWENNAIKTIFTSEDCHTSNSTKNNPALTADIFGDWREEIIMAKSDNLGLRIYSTTIPTDYKIKTLMHDPVYRMGVAAEQTAYNQPPHVGIYMADEAMKGSITKLTVNAGKSVYNVGDELDKSTLTVTAAYKNGDVETVSDYEISGYNPMTTGEQTVTVTKGNVTATFKVTVSSGFTVNSDGFITGYSGAATATLPVVVNGTAVKGIADGALVSSGITRLYIYDDPASFGTNSLPSGITLVCFEGSATQAYAQKNSIKYELMKAGKYYTNVTFEETDYAAIAANTAIVKQGTSNDTVSISPLTFTAIKRDQNGDGTTGIYKQANSGNSYLEGRTGGWNNANRHAFITLDKASEAEAEGNYILEFDFMIPANELDTTISLLSSASGTESGKFASGNANVVYALCAGKNNISADTWYKYSLNCKNGTYTQTITSSDGSVVLTPAVTKAALPEFIAFTAKTDNTGSAYIDNIMLYSPLTSNITLTVTDSDGIVVPNASVTIDGETKTTDANGTVIFTLSGGQYEATVTHAQLQEYVTTVIAYAETQTKNIQLDSHFPYSQAATPSISVQELSLGKQVSISCSTPGAEIYYITTDDNSEFPTIHNEHYTAPFTLYESTIVKAVAIADKHEMSDTASQNIEIAKPFAQMPSITIANVNGGKEVDMLSNTEGADIYYTTDGTIPTASSTKYTGTPLTITDTTTIKAVTVKAKYENSPVASAKVTVSKAAAPTADVKGGTVDFGTLVSLSTETNGADIYYTADGSDPSKSSKKYTSPIAITSDITVKAIAVKDGYAASDIFTASYTVKAPENGKVSITIGSVVSDGVKDGIVSVPVYIFMDKDTAWDFEDIAFDIMYNDSILHLSDVSDSDNGFVRLTRGEHIKYEQDLDAESDMFYLDFDILDNMKGGSYPITIDTDSITFVYEGGFDTDITVGSIVVSTPSPSVNASVILTDSEGSEITSGDNLKEITSSIIIDDATIDENSEEYSKPVSVITAIYDKNGVLVETDLSSVYVSDMSKTQTHTFTVSDGTEVGSIKMYIWKSLNEMIPLSPPIPLVGE